MNEKKEFIVYILISCVSYTVLSTVLSFLAIFDLVMTIDHFVMLQLFLCTSSIGITLAFVEKLNVKSELFQIVIQLLVIMAIVFICGTTFSWFVYDFNVLGIVIFVIFVVYFITYGIMMLLSIVTSNKINMMIKKRRNQ